MVKCFHLDLWQKLVKSEWQRIVFYAFWKWAKNTTHYPADVCVMCACACMTFRRECAPLRACALRSARTHLDKKVATWLILPVVIRSSQRLSHACLSINLLLWNCERLIISVIVYLIVPYYLDNRSNSRANTCVNTLPG